ncbi:uncharacterized protein ACNLHF_028257 [Anomaloglossus baeobatrachus]
MTTQRYKYQAHIEEPHRNLDTQQLNMKATIILIAFGLFFISADALRCKKMSCLGERWCFPKEETCDQYGTHCYRLYESSPIRLKGGCIKESDCQKMTALKPQTRCCNTDLCN